MATLMDSYTDTSDSSFPTYGASRHYKRGQTVTALYSYNLTSIWLSLDKDGSPGNVSVRVDATDSGLPTGSALSTGTILEASLPATEDWVECTMTSCAIVTGTQYAVYIATPSGSSGNCVNIHVLDNGAYTTGTVITYDDVGETWTIVDDDAPFKVYGAGFPIDPIVRVTSLIHRYDRGTYTLELNLGEVVSDFGLPEWESKPRKAIEPTAEEKEAFRREEDERLRRTQIVPPTPTEPTTEEKEAFRREEDRRLRVSARTIEDQRRIEEEAREQERKRKAREFREEEEERLKRGR